MRPEPIEPDRKPFAARKERRIISSAYDALASNRELFLGFLVKRLGNRADAEDVLQEFCVRVLSRAAQVRDVERMDAWLYAVLRSTLNDHYRKSGRRARAAEALVREPDWREESRDKEPVELCTCAGSLLSSLRPAEAEIIRQIDLEGGDRAQIAAGFGLTRGALAVRLHRAHTSLREAVLNYCGPCCEMRRDDCDCAGGGCETTTETTTCPSLNSANDHTEGRK